MRRRRGRLRRRIEALDGVAAARVATDASFLVRALRGGEIFRAASARFAHLGEGVAGLMAHSRTRQVACAREEAARPRSVRRRSFAFQVERSEVVAALPEGRGLGGGRIARETKIPEGLGEIPANLVVPPHLVARSGLVLGRQGRTPIDPPLAVRRAQYVRGVVRGYADGTKRGRRSRRLGDGRRAHESTATEHENAEHHDDGRTFSGPSNHHETSRARPNDTRPRPGSAAADQRISGRRPASRKASMPPARERRSTSLARTWC